SVWLGAPGIMMKIAFFAVLRIVALPHVVFCANISIGETKYPVKPVAAILKKILLSIIASICASVVKKELKTVQQNPLQALGGDPRPLLLECRPEICQLRICRWSRQGVQEQLLNDRR